jgi:peptidoglycan/LPS O-acetylase OafA/YrhL
MLIAELDHLKSSTTTNKSPVPPLSASSTTSTNPKPRPLTTYILTNTLWLLTFLSGLHLLTVANINPHLQTGYQTLLSLVPHWYGDGPGFLRIVGAVLTTWSVANSIWLQPIFTNALVSYLGGISYALYIVHGNVLKTFGYVVMPWTYRVLCNGGEVNSDCGMGAFVGAWALGMVIVGTVVFWVADLFWRGVDAQAMRFARTLEGWVCLSEGREGG